MKSPVKCCISMLTWQCAPAVSSACPKPPAIFPPIPSPLLYFLPFFIRPRISSALMRRTEEGEGGPEREGPLGVARQGLIVIGRALFSLSPLTLADCTLLPTSTHSTLLSLALALFLCFF